MTEKQLEKGVYLKSKINNFKLIIESIRENPEFKVNSKGTIEVQAGFFGLDEDIIEKIKELILQQRQSRLILENCWEIFS